ncbi:MAG: DUF1453 family protein [Betaproteobacteria bacterium]|nr:DUF1453 family protein [Betaproteobacteria bacterium]MBV9360273.1 DUF1453 family protein [Betaproteobacteria bacterium]
MQAPGLLAVGIVLLIAWRVYARIRRMVGRQRLSRVRPWITLAVFSLITVLFTVSTVAHPERLFWLAVALACGGALAVYGLKLTNFEVTPQGLFYTPNAHLGIALSVLFVARIVYRLVEIYGFGTAPQPGSLDFVRSPLTLAIFGLLAGYYVGYAIGLLRWRFAARRRQAETT